MNKRKLVVSVKNLVRTYKKGRVLTPAVRGVSLNLFEGDFIALTGPTGSGKSTLLHQIGILDKPTEGIVKIENEDINQLTESQKSEFRLNKIGYIFQNYELLPDMTALENVYLPLAVDCGFSKTCTEKAKKILEDLGLGERLDHYPAELSGGEQQRVAIARAIIRNPRLILADEPTANLDSVAGKKIIELMRSLNKKYKMTFLVVTHEKEFEKYFDKVIRIKDGQIVKID